MRVISTIWIQLLGFPSLLCHTGNRWYCDKQYCWMAQMTSTVPMWTDLVGYHLLTIFKETVGIERAIGSIIYAQGWAAESSQSQKATLIWYHDVTVLGKSYIATSLRYSALVKRQMRELYTGTDLETTIDELRERILQNNVSGTNSIEAVVKWFDSMSEYLDIVKKVQDSLANYILNRAQEDVSVWKGILTRELLLLVLAVIVMGVIVGSMMLVTKQAQTVSLNLEFRKNSIEKERRRSERLLLQMIPKVTMKKLQSGCDVFPEEFDSVTILFSDIFDFSTVCSHSEPLNIVHILNAVYVAIDNMVEKYDVYKVETIGDIYMMASGVPNRNKRHATELATMATNLLHVTSSLNIRDVTGHGLQLRIGLNTGPVMAGTVGIVVPRYCLFGDTVNIASRMLTTGAPSKIQASESTFRELSDDGKFRFETRGEVSIKGNGVMTTYWLFDNEDPATTAVQNSQ